MLPQFKLQKEATTWRNLLCKVSKQHLYCSIDTTMLRDTLVMASTSENLGRSSFELERSDLYPKKKTGKK